MSPVAIQSITEAERERAINSLLMGFSADPFGRWFSPEANEYLKSAPSFDAFSGRAIDHGTGYATKNFEGVAMWLPPGIEPDEDRFIEEMQKTVAEELHENVFAVFEAMEDYHPGEPCWYLPMIAVDPFYRGQGIGSQLMKHALQRIDEEGLPAYLESSNPQNISLYERFGFEIMGKIEIGSAPPIHPMLRTAR